MSDLKDVSKLEEKNSEVKSIIEKLESGELEVREVPEEYTLNRDVVRAERRLGIRKSGHRGFDVITQKFFVEEQWFHKDFSNNLVPELYQMIFDSFGEYYQLLDGDVYEDACYYQYTFEDAFSRSINLDMNSLTKPKSFVTETIGDYSCLLLQDEIAEYNWCESANKKLVKQWIDKFNDCDTYEQFQRVCSNYEKSTVAQLKGIEFFFFQYAYGVQSKKSHLNVIMEYLSKDYYLGNNAVLGLCLVYEPEDILCRYNYSQASTATNRKRKKDVEEFANELERRDFEVKTRGYFDLKTHFYCEEKKVYRYENCQGRKILNHWRSVDVCRAFETFDAFIEYRNGDLRNCDLSGAIDLNIDFSIYKTDDTTQFPLTEKLNLNYKVTKTYSKGKFCVEQFWYNEMGKCVKHRPHVFTDYFDFVAFLQGDLSNADLVFCTGMKNLTSVEGINLNNVKMTSEVCEKFNILYKAHECDEKFIGEFSVAEKNERATALVLRTSRENVSNDDSMFWKDDNRISYISDLHLMHRIKNAGCKSVEDIIYVMQKIIDNILMESNTITLIGGDVASEFSIFELFIKMLRKSVDELYEKWGVFWKKRNFIFVLGNHELWNFTGTPMEQIVEKYRMLLQENGMYLLHNDLFYKNESDDMGVIPYSDLINLNELTLLDKLRCARLVILGGLGFSGYNEEFNANDGVYKSTIDRNTEIQESKKFEQLYHRLAGVLSEKNTIIFTHTPKTDWCAEDEYCAKFVYVSGHNHKNIFFDDGEERVYADNQIGYRNEDIHLKNFLIDGEYDYFYDYENGVYEITSQEYKDFSRGKNINMTFNRRVNILYMLKKDGYYCFIHKTKAGNLSMLNGGALKKLDIKDVRYYYDNMDKVIAAIKTPLKKYTDFQQCIAKEIKKIGGVGRIHGCVIDIDYFNHIYVNPVDMKVTSYWAIDIVNKQVYSDVSTLLKFKCPILYSNFKRMIEGERENPLMIKQKKNEISLLPQEYLETDIYKASREIKKMQKLNSNVLTTWYNIDSRGN